MENIRARERKRKADKEEKKKMVIAIIEQYGENYNADSTKETLIEDIRRDEGGAQAIIDLFDQYKDEIEKNKN